MSTRVVTFRCDSKDKTDSNDSNTAFQIDVRHSALQKIRNAGVVYASFPYVFDNVTWNNSTVHASYLIGGMPFTLIVGLNLGNYTDITLIVAQLQAAAQTQVDPSVDVVLNADGYIEFQTSLGDSVTINTQFTTVRQLIGFVPKHDGDVSQNTLVMSALPSLLGPQSAYIYAREMNDEFIDSEIDGSHFNCVAVIDMGGAPYGSMIQFEPPRVKYNTQYYGYELQGRDLTTLHIRLRDEDGHLLDLKNFNMQLVIRAYRM